MKKLLWVISLLCLSWGAVADVIFVKSERAKLVDSPSFKGVVLAELVRGNELELLETQKSWRKVSVSGMEGWISGLLVSSEPPVAKVSHIGTDDSSVSGSVRTRASAVATGGATRGLMADNSEENLNSDYSELVELEQHQYDQNEIESFIAELN